MLPSRSILYSRRERLLLKFATSVMNVLQILYLRSVCMEVFALNAQWSLSIQTKVNASSVDRYSSCYHKNIDHIFRTEQADENLLKIVEDITPARLHFESIHEEEPMESQIPESNESEVPRATALVVANPSQEQQQESNIENSATRLIARDRNRLDLDEMDDPPLRPTRLARSNPLTVNPPPTAQSRFNISNGQPRVLPRVSRIDDNRI